MEQYAIYNGSNANGLDPGRIYKVLTVVTNIGEADWLDDELVLAEKPGHFKAKDFTLLKTYKAYSVLSPNTGERCRLTRIVGRIGDNEIAQNVLTGTVILSKRLSFNKYIAFTKRSTYYITVFH